jgi:hypothetical protein
MIKRTGARSFTDDSPDDGKELCSSCYEQSIDSRLIPYDKDPDHFMIYPYCNNIVNKKLTRHLSETQPLGYKSRVGEAKFEVANPSRSRSKSILNKDSEVFKFEDIN